VIRFLMQCRIRREKCRDSTDYKEELWQPDNVKMKQAALQASETPGTEQHCPVRMDMSYVRGFRVWQPLPSTWQWGWWVAEIQFLFLCNLGWHSGS
jgi:hypothetical protein